MSLGKGTASFKVFKIDGKVSTDDRERFDCFNMGKEWDLSKIKGEPVTFWAGPKMMTDFDMSAENCVVGSFLCFNLTTVVRKIPGALLKETVAKDEQIELKARGVPYLNKAARREIKKFAEERLLPQMPLSITATQVLIDTYKDIVVATALSDKAADALTAAFRAATGLGLIPMSPAVCAERPRETELGLEFMTWLWYAWENGLMENLLMEGPLVLEHAGTGAHECVVRKGMPTLSPEATVALRQGKQLRKAKLTIANGDEQTSFTVDGADFSFRGVKFPNLEPSDEATRFRERMAQVVGFTDLFYAIYTRFLEVRSDDGAWAGELEKVTEWKESRV